MDSPRDNYFEADKKNSDQSSSESVQDVPPEVKVSELFCMAVKDGDPIPLDNLAEVPHKIHLVWESKKKVIYSQKAGSIILHPLFYLIHFIMEEIKEGSKMFERRKTGIVYTCFLKDSH